VDPVPKLSEAFGGCPIVEQGARSLEAQRVGTPVSGGLVHDSRARRSTPYIPLAINALVVARCRRSASESFSITEPAGELHMEVIECTRHDVASAADLFNHYRMFYEWPDDLDKSRNFLRANPEHQRSRIFLVSTEEKEAVAFAQLYPATCSLAMKHFYWLYGLFVDPQARGTGGARMLLDYLANMARAEGAHRISLDTAKTNLNAQKLYRSQGYKAEGEFLTYHLML
jgi:ribosomal protein S18 acetylase RimI-like enzyme